LKLLYEERVVLDIPDISKLFRAYDIRGIVGQTLNEDIIYKIGRALASEAREQGEKTLFVARDARLSSESLFKALTKGLLETGCNVIDIGIVPTPLLYFATHFFEHTSGVMLTGSHNAAEYNGLKIVLKHEALSKDAIEKLYERIIKSNFYTPEDSDTQPEYQTQNVQETYLRSIVENIELKQHSKVVLDCGNGVTGVIAPELFTRLGCEVIVIHGNLDGNFPNHHPDPSVPENLQDLIAAVKAHRADIGLAFDGDGDRLGVVTPTGEIIYPDRQLMLFSKDLLLKNPGSKIVYDVKCTLNLEKFIKEQGGIPVMAQTGHTLIKAKMLKTKAMLAGEMSGHLFFKDRWYGFDDALYAGARLLEILSYQAEHRTDEVFNKLPNECVTAEIRIPVKQNEEKFELIKKFTKQAKKSKSFSNAKLIKIDGFRVEYPDGTWGVIRASNTGDYLTLRFGAADQTRLEQEEALFHKILAEI